MYIKEYRCKRFAGLRDVNLEFVKGLNVILGDNETGKSTIIEAINASLFKEIRLTKRDNIHKEFAHRFMPRPDGDYIDSQVTIETKEGAYELYKEWGSSESISLINPNGSVLKNEKEINSQLSKILALGESTYSNIVFAKQRDLKNSLNNIISNNNITNEINDLLRKSMMELDGVSIDKIEANISKEVENLYKRWDRGKNYPENNKGINNPYKTGLGLILEAYYKKEGLKLDMEEADRTEKDFEKISKGLLEVEARYKELNEEKESLELVEGDINKRKVLDIEVRSLRKEADELKEINRLWPLTEERLKQLDISLKDLTGKKDDLVGEKARLEAFKRKLEVDKKLEIIESYKARLEALQEELTEIPRISQENIDYLTSIEMEILKLDASMEASKIEGQVLNSSEPLYILRAYGEKEEVTIGEKFQANGLVNISHNDMELEIRVGDRDFEELKASYRALELDLKESLESLKIESKEEGKLNLEKVKKIKTDRESYLSKIDTILDEDSLEALKEEAEALKDLESSKDLEDIENQLDDLRSRETDLILDKRNKSDLLKQWEVKYEEFDKLMDLLVDHTASLRTKEKELANLAPLPEEFQSPDDFNSRLRDIKEGLKDLESTREDLRQDYYDAKARLLDISYEELKKEHSYAEDLFERHIRRGEKLLEIQRVFLETKEKLFSNPMEELVAEFARLLSLITEGKYKSGDIDEGFNISLEGHRGDIPIDLLSAGTYDSVSLALRFSLLKHLFDDGGFVVLDDCLVDLDKGRKRQAIELIQDLAKDYQIIFTTCNPEIASALGGNLIEM